MSENRKIAAILVSDVVGYSRLAGADEDRILARLRTLRSDLIDPLISVHHGRIVKRTGDGSIIEFRSVVDAVRLAIEVQNGMIESRNCGDPAPILPDVDAQGDRGRRHMAPITRPDVINPLVSSFLRSQPSRFQPRHFRPEWTKRKWRSRARGRARS
jgi:hypothetical protein